MDEKWNLSPRFKNYKLQALNYVFFKYFLRSFFAEIHALKLTKSETFLFEYNNLATHCIISLFLVEKNLKRPTLGELPLYVTAK